MKVQFNVLKKSLLLTCLGVSFIGIRVSAADFEAQAKHAIAVEISTGKILYEKDAKSADAIASITKLLTIYMVYQKISSGALTWETQVPISDYAYELTQNYEVSNVPMDARQYTVKELVEASLISSSNSAAIALAEQVSGSEPAFVDDMIAQLKAWGITDAKLVNASGLNNSYLGEHRYPNSGENDENAMSAQSVAIIAHHLVTEYPEVLKITSQSHASFAGIEMTSYNYMLEDFPYYRPGVTGLKTGTTDLAGASFVATSTENDMQVITVILNADYSDIDPAYRFVATNALLDYVATNFQLTELVKKDQAFDDSKADIKDGKEKTVSAVANQTFTVVTPINDEPVKATFKQDKLVAPVQAGEPVGMLTYDDQNLIGDGYIDDVPSTPLVAGESVKRDFFLKIFWNDFVRYVNEKL